MNQAEKGTLGTLLPRIAAGTLLILVAGTLAANNNATGDFDRLLYVAVLAVALATTVAFLRTQRSGVVDAALALIAAAGLTWGIWTIERPQLLSEGLWEGFGYRVAIAAMVMVLLLATVVRPRNLTQPVRAILGLIVAFCCVCDVISAIRTLTYMPYVNNNLNEINDMLGPLVGKIPGSSFVPEYTSLYGWLFVPFKHILSPLVMVGAMTIFLTLLGFAAVGLALWMVARMIGNHGWLLGAALVVPITYVTSHVTGDVNSIASLFQELPIRLFSGFIIASLGLTDLMLIYRGTLRPRQVTLIGALCGLVAWNSQDFGLAAAIVYGLMILVVATASTRWRAAGFWFAGLVVGLAAYPVFLLAIGSPLDLSLVGAFVRLAGSGLGSAAIQVPGPVLIVVPVIVCSAAAGWAMVQLRRRDGSGGDRLLDRATLTVTFVGTWSAVCLVYYVNRAYAAGQLQTMLLPTGVCIAGLLAIAVHTNALSTVWPEQRGVPPLAGLVDKIRLFPLGVLVCLCFSSVLLTPDPVLAARTLLDPPALSGYATYDLPEVLAVVNAAQRFTSSAPGTLSYLGESFNYVTLATDVPSDALLFPFSLTPKSASVIQLECEHLAAHHSRWIVLSLDGVFAFGDGVCGMYRSVTLPGFGPGQLQELK